MRLLALVVVTSAELEQSSLLQSNVKKDNKNRVDILPALAHATQELRQLREDTSDEQIAASLNRLFEKAKQTSTSVLQLPDSEQSALLRRASQGNHVQQLSESFGQLPDKVQSKVIKALASSEDMLDTFDSLPQSEQRGVLLELDKSTTGKTCRRCTRGGRNDARCCTTFSRNGRGGTEHTHWTSDFGSGTETSTRNKDGELVHTHSHSHTHNGRGGNARTETTTTGKDNYRHDHSTSHNYNNGRTTSETNSGTTFHGGENTHSHSHSHSHKPGENTQTNTGTTSTDSGGRFHGHGHFHNHNEETGETRTITTHCDGPDRADCEKHDTNR